MPPVNGLRAAALAALLGGIALLAYAAMQGSVRVGLFLIVPFVYGTGGLPFLGMLLLMLAGVLWFLSLARAAHAGYAPEDAWAPPPSSRPPSGAPEEGAPARRRSSSGGVVLIGPIPIVWGSDRRVLKWMVAAGAALLLLGFLLTRG